MMVAKSLHTGPSSSRNIQLHSVVEETVVLLPVTLVLA
jgi:hypothetical protein